MEHHPFPEIGQFRNVIKKVTDRARFKGLNLEGEPLFDPFVKLPVLKFEGTVKLHGTNAAIVFTEEGVQYQSRERILTAEADNAGFLAACLQDTGIAIVWEDIMTELYGTQYGDVFGEWCGGNIQKGVAINGLPKMFVVFAIRTEDGWWHPPAGVSIPEYGVYAVSDFKRYEIDIDFENPAASQNRLVEITNAVEAECPVGKYFGKEGVGEGVVWRCVTPGYESSDFWFKVKGKKHSESKVKTLAEVDVEALRAVSDFVDRVVTPERMAHALHHITEEMQKPLEMSSIGDFLRRVFNDVLKEEADVIAASGFEQKGLGKPISIAAKRWFVEQLNS